MNPKKLVWEVTQSPYPSEFLKQSLIFGKGPHIFLIDPYDGKKPMLKVQEFSLTVEKQLHMHPIVLLDSNLMRFLENAVQEGKATDLFGEFLHFLVKNGYGLNLTFYYCEHYAKSPNDFREHAKKRTKALLQLQTMNKQHFLATGEIIPDPDQVAHCLNKYGATNLFELAENDVEAFIKTRSTEIFENLLEAIECALIKMFLIQKVELAKASRLEKILEFHRFLRKDLGIILAREAHIALHYFCDKAGKLLGVQTNTSYTKAVATIKSTMWDMFLLRTPELFFTQASDEVPIPYLATQEKALYELGRLYTIERIENSGISNIEPAVSYDLTNIPEEIQVGLPAFIPIDDQGGYKTVPVGLRQALYDEL